MTLNKAQIDHVLGELRRIVAQPFQDSYQQIDPQWDTIASSQRARNSLQNQLRDIKEECARISFDIAQAAGDVLTATATRETVSLRRSGSRCALAPRRGEHIRRRSW